ncbi:MULTISPECIES: CPBP family glutamic-type intramembrane protease [unclassified Marinobacter]|uniref:CPBP family glutamic-type intramembrane protease n=1 Tax=unclassified Marinobacter TaxID=83889 RepID=UPI00192568B8|nr:MULTISPECIES: CPBP family glutamic-type intramembrane protease [unclassified Marinobacter]MBL3827123.1 CPBP family intramembrane metalloprotease [Marinobacter sp. MC3]MBL3895652.1 CPBP family intramembrane metalloprotease [Marinobacter sp. MW3]
MNWRLAFLVALVAIPGPIAISWLALPILIDTDNLSVPLQTLQIATAAQSIVLVALAAGLGTFLSAKVGFRAPVLTALAKRGDFLPAIAPQLLPGVIGGILGAAVIVGFYEFSPKELAVLQETDSIPLAARVLYGGITEEVLVRWGLMTTLVWLGWRVLQRGKAAPSGTVVWLGIGISALLFGVSHVPSVVAAVGGVPLTIVAYITLGNALFGLVAGILFWRYGLEAAITAHVLAHIIAYGIHG